MAQTAGSLSYAELFTTSRPRILLAETDSQMRQYLTQLLFQHYDVEVAPDASSALALARERPPELVVANLSMRTTEEFELLRAFGRDEMGKVPIILYSTAEGDDSSGNALE